MLLPFSDMSLRQNLTKLRRHPRVSDLGSMSELTNQIAAFMILKVITIILTQRHIRKREQHENMILILI
jgi:hypothetical protein